MLPNDIVSFEQSGPDLQQSQFDNVRNHTSVVRTCWGCLVTCENRQINRKENIDVENFVCDAAQPPSGHLMPKRRRIDVDAT